MATPLNQNQTFASPQEALTHYGVKGMRWGHRKKESSQKKGKQRIRNAVKSLSKQLDEMDPVTAILAGTLVAGSNTKYNSVITDVAISKILWDASREKS